MINQLCQDPSTEADSWAVEITSSQMDLEEAVSLLRYVQPIRIGTMTFGANQHVVLIADEFNPLTDGVAVLSVADRLLEKLSAIMFSLDAARTPLRTTNRVFQQIERVWSEGSFFQGGPAQLMLRGSRPTVMVNGQLVDDSLELFVQRAMALEDDHVLDVLYAIRGQAGWFDLWKAQERFFEQDDYPGRDVKWFRQTATLERHSRTSDYGKTAQEWLDSEGLPKMSIHQARKVVGEMVKKWLANPVILSKAERDQRVKRRKAEAAAAKGRS